MSFSSDVAFTDAVKRIQTERGSRHAYARMEEQRGGFAREVTPELAAFLAERDSVYLATANAEGQPYVQHRGGPRGFVRVLDAHTLAFADFVGNKQYITTGNLAENDRVFLFAMDYAQAERMKIWGRARVVADDPALLAQLADPSYPARLEQAIVFTVTAWDANCDQHIPRLLDANAVAAHVRTLEERIATLEAQLRAAGQDVAGANASIR
jgi:predicted pyridoxine 5'-phosphate oxidase superfamily flavin-nucleotide-binding protein